MKTVKDASMNNRQHPTAVTVPSETHSHSPTEIITGQALLSKGSTHCAVHLVINHQQTHTWTHRYNDPLYNSTKLNVYTNTSSYILQHSVLAHTRNSTQKIFSRIKYIQIQNTLCGHVSEYYQTSHITSNSTQNLNSSYPIISPYSKYLSFTLWVPQWRSRTGSTVANWLFYRAWCWVSNSEPGAFETEPPQ